MRTQSFLSLDAKPGGARIHRPAPSLSPGLRLTRGDNKVETARPKVEEMFHAEGTTSHHRCETKSAGTMAMACTRGRKH